MRATGELRRKKRRTLVRAALGEPLVIVGVSGLLLVLVLAVLGPSIPAYEPFSQSLRDRNLPPGTLTGDGRWLILGSDQLGRDVLSRLILGARYSLVVSVSAVFLASSFGVIVGAVAGMTRGWLDSFLMRAVDVQMSFPLLVLALFVLYALGPGFWNTVLVLAIASWPLYARLSRGIALAGSKAEYVLAARGLGVRTPSVLFRHILPQMYSPLLIIGTLEVGRMVLFEATLSFLGLGVQPPGASWGLMVAEGRDYLATAWWLVVIPGLAIFVTTLSLALLATWTRSVLDPAQRWKWLSHGDVSTEPSVV